MTRYISDRDIAALAQSGDQYDDLGPEPEEAGIAISFPMLAGITAGVVLAIVVAWIAVDQFAGPGTVPLVTASADPIKVRPQTPGGLDIPFQNMALYDRLEPGSEVEAPVLAPLPEQPDRGALDPAPVLQDGEAIQAQSAPMSGTELTFESPESSQITSAQSLAAGEGESLFATAPVMVPPVSASPLPPLTPSVPESQEIVTSSFNDVPVDDTPPITGDVTVETTDPAEPAASATTAIENPPSPIATNLAGGPPIPARHPGRGGGGVAMNSASSGVESFFPTAGQDGDEQRRIRRGTIASTQIPLDAAQNGLRPGGALGATDDTGTLIYRNSLRQETTAPLPSGPVEGEVQLVLQPPAGQPSNLPPALQPPAISITPQQPTRSADGTIEIRSPNRETIDIRSPDQVAAVPAAPPSPPSRTHP